ncbi:MAG: hypothetical protein K8J09_20785 [Planctomycetes bacterium]|nr:hypothetical protein [Planctomycetota bacterium]MCC7399625.1 hypothetical protein [Planctomycetota bacterium]
MAQNFDPPQARYSTHDNTQPVPANPPHTEVATNFQEWWVDAKTPGDGFVYSAGTITVNQTVAPLFSGQPVAVPPPPSVPFTLGGSGALLQRQVGMLQIVSNGQGISNQAYFYGRTPNEDQRATNVRGISVWPTGNPDTTRIAICGESFDEELPECDSATSWAGASPSNSGGFIAIYNGNADLQWTWHFHGGTGAGSTAGRSAVTDVSIRVDAEGAEVVTYCGISTHGNPANNGTLDVLAPFVMSSGAQGNTDNGAGQWDGFVGRLVRPNGGNANKVFHSVVGGSEQDGLFGLAEIDVNRFMVVGSTGIPAAVAPGATAFPGVGVGTFGTYSIGVGLVFDASALPGGSLVLESAQGYGTTTAGTCTVARDVVVQPGFVGGFPLAVIVGSTNDAGLLASLPGLTSAGHAPQATLGGGVDGFILATMVGPASQLNASATYRGGEDTEYLTGVNAWNEFTDHFVVTGVGDGANGNDIEVAGFVLDTDPGFLLDRPLVALTSVQLASGGDDHPTAIGALNATGGFDTYGLGDPQGGGVAVDENARVNVVGTTNGATYPVSPAGPINFVFGAGRNKSDLTGVMASYDATRTVLDLLPARAIALGGPAVVGAVGRTDGTGQLPTGVNGGTPTYPLAGLFGGTTPECSLLPFGNQIGVAPAGSPNRRMLIDYDGPVPAAGAPMTLVVSRPAASLTQVSVWEIGFPGAFMAPAYLPGGALLWSPNLSVVWFHFSAEATELVPLTLPVGTGTITVQMTVAGLVTPVDGNNAGGAVCVSGQMSTYASTPALWLTY